MRVKRWSGIFTSSKEGEEYEGKAGLRGGYFVIMNKINLVLFFWVIHIIFFKIQMHNYLCFFFCAVPQPTVPPSAPDEALATPGQNNFIGEGLTFCLVLACLYFIFFSV